ncbi:MAG: sulfotransferase, partial [Proteobacteria bacterium]|nr:sulfotransferase [Pseudomonadota bacterium]
EQILASHSQVYGAGELEILSQIVEPTISPRIQSGTAAPLTQDEALSIRRGYLDALRVLDATEPMITDKMPLNFRWLGFFLTAFPEARVIHLNRNPVAVCWSIYKRYFQARGNAYGNNLSDLAAYYRCYREIMEFWREQFPGRIHDVDYEELTENQESGTRQLLAFCNLEWEDQCLRFMKPIGLFALQARSR